MSLLLFILRARNYSPAPPPSRPTRCWSSCGNAFREPAPSLPRVLEFAFSNHGEWDEQGKVSFFHLCCFCPHFSAFPPAVIASQSKPRRLPRPRSVPASLVSGPHDFKVRRGRCIWAVLGESAVPGTPHPLPRPHRGPADFRESSAPTPSPARQPGPWCSAADD